MNKTALILEGGGMRGTYTSGILDYLMEKGIYFDSIYGVSAGALNGVNFKSRQIGRSLRTFTMYQKDKRYAGIHHLLKDGDWFNVDFSYNQIPNQLDKADYDTFVSDNTNFYSVVSNVETGKAEYLHLTDMRKDMDGLRASASLPILSNLVEFNGKKYIDMGSGIGVNAFGTADEVWKEAVINQLDKTTYEIDTSNIVQGSAPFEYVRKMRASYYILGAELGRFGKAKAAYPGGCEIGARPIDQHIKAFEALGAVVKCDDESKSVVITSDKDALCGNSVFMDIVSVGATINAILAAVKVKGTTVIDNAAREPHVVDLANFLNSAGARIVGAGTDVIKIHGVESLKSVTYSIIPDQIEAGTYMAAAVATRGDILVKNIIPKHLDCITSKFIEMGVEVEEYDEEIRVKADKPLKSIRVKTLPYPGFPTDLQPQMVVLLATVGGKSVVTEGVWESRFQYIEELEKMGIRVSVDGTVATIDGGVPLKAAKLRATDLRAGASMIIAALAGEGTSEIYELRHIDRGYEHIVEKLRGMGADIERVDD